MSRPSTTLERQVLDAFRRAYAAGPRDMVLQVEIKEDKVWTKVLRREHFMHQSDNRIDIDGGK